jgi:hypothetical protein
MQWVKIEKGGEFPNVEPTGHFSSSDIILLWFLVQGSDLHHWDTAYLIMDTDNNKPVSWEMRVGKSVPVYEAAYWMEVVGPGEGIKEKGA